MTSYSTIKEMISSRYLELKGCGANSPGGGGFRTGNTCARGGGSTDKPTKESLEIADKYLDRQMWDQPILDYMSANGVSEEHYRKAQDLMYAHNATTNPGEDGTDAKLYKAFNADDETGRALRLYASLNEHYAEKTNFAPSLDWDNVYKNIDKAADSWDTSKAFFTSGSFFNSAKDYKNFLQKQQSGELVAYRKGGWEKNVLSTTMSSEGAKSGSVFKPTGFRTYSEMRKDGYRLLNSLRGTIGNTAAQEREVVWIKVKK